MIPAVVPAVSRRLALGIAVLAALGAAGPALITVAGAAGDAGGVDIRLGVTSPARVPAAWPGLAVEDVTVERAEGLPSGTVRVGVVAPDGPPRADVLFVHGHSDRMDNHRALFAAWRDAGFRVIAFDLPEHGGTAAGSLDSWDLDQLSVLAARVEERTRADPDRPLLLSGFSLGGELVYHAAAHPDLLARFGRHPAALVLFSPAVAALPFTGGDGVSRARDLVHPGGVELAPPDPAVPLTAPLFATGLLLTSERDQALAPPRDVRVFVAMADEALDRYVDVGRVRAWTHVLARRAVRVDALGCPGARHAVDNEAWPVGGDVIAASRAFLDGVLTARPQRVALRRCRVYQRALLDPGPAR